MRFVLLLSFSYSRFVTYPVFGLVTWVPSCETSYRLQPRDPRESDHFLVLSSPFLHPRPTPADPPDPARKWSTSALSHTTWLKCAHLIGCFTSLLCADWMIDLQLELYYIGGLIRLLVIHDTLPPSVRIGVLSLYPGWGSERERGTVRGRTCFVLRHW